MGAAKGFEAGAGTARVAADLRAADRSVRRWRAAWRAGGAGALASAGPMSVEKLSPGQWQRLEAELKRGPLAHGFDDGDQGWTLKRVKLLIGRLFHVGYTLQGVWRLLKRHDWSCQVPVRRALERDEAAIEVWKAEGVAAGRSTAHDLGAHVCFADESGQSLILPRGRTWAPRGARPVVRAAGQRGGRVNIVGAVCFKPGCRPADVLQTVQYRPELITGCLPPTGLDLHGLIETPDFTDSS